MYELGQNDSGSFIIATEMYDVTAGAPVQSNISDAVGIYSNITSATVEVVSGDIRTCGFTMKIDGQPINLLYLDCNSLTDISSVQAPTFMVWVDNGDSTRTLLASFQAGMDFFWGDPFDLTYLLSDPILTGMVGTERRIFFTQQIFNNPQHNEMYLRAGLVSDSNGETTYDISTHFPLQSGYNAWLNGLEGGRGIIIPDYTNTNSQWSITGQTIDG